MTSAWRPLSGQLLLVLGGALSSCAQMPSVALESAAEPIVLPSPWTSTPFQVVTPPSSTHAPQGEPSLFLGLSTVDPTRIAPSATPLPFHVAPATDARIAYETSAVRSLNHIMNPDHTLTLTENESLLWSSGWCASSQEQLDQNYEVMETRLYVDSYLINPKYYSSTDYESNDPEHPANCRSSYILIDSWREGRTCLEVRHAILEPLSDGWNEYPKGPISSWFCVTLDLK
jgi:hypothetical protein